MEKLGNMKCGDLKTNTWYRIYWSPGYAADKQRCTVWVAKYNLFDHLRLAFLPDGRWSTNSVVSASFKFVGEGEVGTDPKPLSNFRQAVMKYDDNGTEYCLYKHGKVMKTTGRFDTASRIVIKKVNDLYKLSHHGDSWLQKGDRYVNSANKSFNDLEFSSTGGDLFRIEQVC